MPVAEEAGALVFQQVGLLAFPQYFPVLHKWFIFQLGNEGDKGKCNSGPWSPEETERLACGCLCLLWWFLLSCYKGGMLICFSEVLWFVFVCFKQTQHVVMIVMCCVYCICLLSFLPGEYEWTIGFARKKMSSQLLRLRCLVASSGSERAPGPLAVGSRAGGRAARTLAVDEVWGPEL